MPEFSQTLSVRQAARMVFNTRHPTSDQLDAIEERLKSGLLEGSLHRKKWTTTPHAVAAYLAKSTLLREENDRTPPKSAVEPVARRHREQTQTLFDTYQDALAGYFLAVVLRRRAEGHSAQFRIAVMATRIALLVGIAGVFAWTLIPSLFQVRPSEELAVEAWLDVQHRQYKVTKWFPPVPADDGDGTRIRVQYRYQGPRKRFVETDRTFVVVGDQVISVNSGDH